MQVGPLPNEIWDHILSFCSPKSFPELTRVCKLFHSFIKEEDYIKFKLREKLQGLDPSLIDEALSKTAGSFKKVTDLKFEPCGKLFDDVKAMKIKLDSGRDNFIKNFETALKREPPVNLPVTLLEPFDLVILSSLIVDDTYQACVKAWLERQGLFLWSSDIEKDLENLRERIKVCTKQG